MQKTDQRTRLTKMLIKDALIKLLKEKPLQNISVKELCEIAEINRGTFYNNYLDIYDLMNQLEEELLEDLIETLRPLKDEKNGLRITTQVFDCLKENADLCQITLGPYGDKQFINRLLKMAEELVYTSYSSYFKMLNKEKLTYFYAFVSSGCIGVIEKWLAEGMVTPTDKLAKMVEKMIFKGIDFLM